MTEKEKDRQRNSDRKTENMKKNGKEGKNDKIEKEKKKGRSSMNTQEGSKYKTVKV